MHVGSSSILCQFCQCCVHNGFSGIRGELKEDSKFQFQLCVNQQIDIIKDCRGIEFNGHSFKILEKLPYFGDILGAKGGAVGNVCSLQLPFLASRGVKGTLYFVC